MWEEDKLKKLTVDFYKHLFTEDEVPNDEISFFSAFPDLENSYSTGLLEKVSDEEICKAVFDMKPFKALGTYGFQPYFFQTQWSVVGGDLCRFIKEVFANKQEVAEVNHSYLVLIPKVPKPECIHQFRPIGLCNVIYKTLTKILVNRLKPLMQKLVSMNQSSFVPGRQIVDNIIIAQEIIHSMRNLKRKKGVMAIKVDLEKAYDRLRWDFIRDTLTLTGIPRSTVDLIMKCIETTSLSVLWNGSPSKKFLPTRGIRQGDPLSLYIFVLCMERLSQLIHREVSLGNWKPFQIGREGPKISHICFADDMLLFAEASEGQLDKVLECLTLFCCASGQWVSVEKTKMFFSKDVSHSAVRSLSYKSGFAVTQDLGKYLGSLFFINALPSKHMVTL